MKRRLYVLGAAMLVLLAACGILLLTGINCPIRWMTGAPCPGCGMTRAGLSLVFGNRFSSTAGYRVPVGLVGNLQAAWHFHPLIFAAPLVLLYALVGTRPLFGSKRREGIFIATACFFMVSVYLVRLVLHDPVLQINWNEGAIARAFHLLINGFI